MLISGNAEYVGADGIFNLLEEDSTLALLGTGANAVKKSSCTCGWNSTDGETSSCSCDGNQADRDLVPCTLCGRNKLDLEMSFCTCDGNQHDGGLHSEGNASPESQPADSKDLRNTNYPWRKAAVGLGITGLVIPLAFPMVVTAVGFGAGGIVAGSPAALFMASYGGAVAPGSLCAVLQSIGATGAIAGGSTITSLGAGLTTAGVASCEEVKNGAISAAKSVQAASFFAVNILRAKIGGKAK